MVKAERIQAEPDCNFTIPNVTSVITRLPPWYLASNYPKKKQTERRGR